MAESTLSNTLTDLRKEVARYLGFGNDATYGSLLTGQPFDVDACIKQGLSWFLMPVTLGAKFSHRWSFLSPTTTITTSAPYETGTVTIVAGSATLAGGTWPAWAADGELIIEGNTYTVATRTSDSIIVLDDTSVTASAGTTYQLIRPIITLPDDFGGLLAPLTWQPGQILGNTLKQVSELAVRDRRQWTDIVDVPLRFAIRPKTFAATTGQRFEIIFEPVPNAAYIFTYTYRVNPNVLTDASGFPYGGALHGETHRLACLAAAELRRNEAKGAYYEEFLTRLQASISLDQEVTAPATLGFDSGLYTDLTEQDNPPRLGGGYSVPDGYTLGN